MFISNFSLVPCPTETQAVHGRKKRSTIHHAQKRCHALNFDGGVCGPLHKCAKKYPDLAKTLYNDCVFDITHISHGQKQIVCNNLEILVDECEQKLAHRIKWRKHFKCGGLSLVYYLICYMNKSNGLKLKAGLVFIN